MAPASTLQPTAQNSTVLFAPPRESAPAAEDAQQSFDTGVDDAIASRATFFAITTRRLCKNPNGRLFRETEDAAAKPGQKVVDETDKVGLPHLRLFHLRV